MKKYFEILKKCPLFYEIDVDNLIPMLKCLDAKICKYTRNQTVFSEGEPAKYVGIILSGGVQIVTSDYCGNRNIIGIVEPSELFGESFACADIQSMPVNAVATEETEVMLIDCKRITITCCNACEFHSRIILNLLKVMAMKNIFLNQKAEITSKRTTKEKLLAFLMLHAKLNNSEKFTIPFDRQELADYLQVDRSGLSAEISKLRNDRIIECRKSEFRLL